MSRSILRSALELRSPITRLPPTFLLPIRARWLSTTQQHVEPTTTTAAAAPLSSSSSSPFKQQTINNLRSAAATIDSAADAAQATANTATATDAVTEALEAEQQQQQQLSDADFEDPAHQRPTLTRPPPPIHTGPLPAALAASLPLLAAQPSHYVTIHIHGRPYLVTPGDSIRLPFKMPSVVPGDVLRLNRASALGSRDFTLRPAAGSEYVDERVFECRATVVGVESEPMRMKTKTKRRNRRIKTVRSKHKYTILRVSELRIRRADEIEV